MHAVLCRSAEGGRRGLAFSENTGNPPFDSFEAYPGNGRVRPCRIRAICITRPVQVLL